jgi:hypothetical protein
MVAPIAPLEMVLKIFSKGNQEKRTKKECVDQALKVLQIVEKILTQAQIGLTSFSVKQLMISMSIYESSEIGLFDSFHAGISQESGDQIISDDEHFDFLKDLHLGFQEYLAQLKTRP